MKNYLFSSALLCALCSTAAAQTSERLQSVPLQATQTAPQLQARVPAAAPVTATRFAPVTHPTGQVAHHAGQVAHHAGRVFHDTGRVSHGTPRVDYPAYTTGNR
jgi:hypothetical protein